MTKRAAPDSPKDDKNPSPSKGSGSGAKKSPNKRKRTMYYHHEGKDPLTMASFARYTAFSDVMYIGAGCIVDIDVAAQPKAVTDIIHIGAGACINIMTSGETQRIAETINIGENSTVNIALDVQIKGAAEAINMEPGSMINIVTRPVDNRCYRGKLNNRSEAVRDWAAFIATAGMVQDNAASGPQEAANTEVVKEDSDANTVGAQGTNQEARKEETGCEMQ